MCTLVDIWMKHDMPLLLTCFGSDRKCYIRWAIMPWFQGSGRDLCMFRLCFCQCMHTLYYIIIIKSEIWIICQSLGIDHDTRVYVVCLNIKIYNMNEYISSWLRDVSMRLRAQIHVWVHGSGSDVACLGSYHGDRFGTFIPKRRYVWGWIWWVRLKAIHGGWVAHIDGLVQDYSNTSVLAMELLQSCPKSSIYISISHKNSFEPKFVYHQSRK